MRTFSQLQTDIFTQLKEEVGDTGFWTIQEVKDALNDTYTDIADWVMCFRAIYIIEIVADVRTYKLPENYVSGSIDRVEFDKERILPVTAEELDDTNLSWRNDAASSPTNYLPPGDVSEMDEIVLYPKPDTAGTVYNLASTSEDYGVITAVYDDSYEEFEQENGTLVSTSGDILFEHENGVVLGIEDPSDNLRVFAARYPKRLYNDNEVFLPPVAHNPKKIFTKGAMAILLAKEGEGKDIAKASFYNKRYVEAVQKIQRPRVKRRHRIGSVTDVAGHRGLNLGSSYPAYIRR